MKKSNLLILFLFFLLFSATFFPILADSMYNIKNNSEYKWSVTEYKGSNSVQYLLTAKFNLNQHRVNITKYFYSNHSEVHYNCQMNEFRKFIIPTAEKSGRHSYFYTGPGSLNFPRHVLIIEDTSSTQVIDYTTGITLYYASDLQEHELVSGTIPISWFIWIILGITISLCCLSLIIIYKKGKRQYPIVIYSTD